MLIAIIVVTIFILSNLIIGILASRKATSETMMNTGRKTGLLLLVFSTFTTSIGAGDIFSYPSLGYLQGWSSLHFILAMPVVIIIMAFTVGKSFYRLNVRTISDVLCKVYGENKPLRILSSLCMAIGLIATTAGQYSAFGKSLNLLTGLPSDLGMFIGAIVFVSYTVAGGLSSVMAVSIIQGSVMIIGMLLVLFATGDAAGGYATVQNLLPVSYKAFWGTSGAVVVITYWINRGLSKFTNFSYWQRLSSAKDEHTGIWGVSIGMAVTGILGTLLAIIGMNALIVTPGMADSELVFVDAAIRYFPKTVSGLILGAIWAAILSSAGSFLNSASTIICNDIWFKALGKESENEGKKRISLRVITAILGVGTFFVALAFPSVLNLLVWSGVSLTPTLVPVLLATLFDKKGVLISKRWLSISIAVALVTGIVFEMTPDLKAFTSGGTIPAFIISLLVILLGIFCNDLRRKGKGRDSECSRN